MAIILISCKLGTIIEKDGIILEKIYSNFRNREQIKHRFVGVVECNVGSMTKDIDGWWSDSGATRHVTKNEK